MESIRVTLANCGFLPKKQAAYLDGDNISVKPEYIEWIPDGPQTARFVTEEYFDVARGKGQIGWILEPFFLHPEPYLVAMRKGFDYVLTHDQTFVHNNENWLWYPAGGSWISFDKWGIHPKTKNVSLLLSNKMMTRGHRLRHEVYKRYGDKIDIFGLDRRVTPFEALADYRYSIIIENERSCGWFTEKLINCLSVSTIPIYWGDPDISKWFNDIIEFEGLSDLDNIFDWLERRDVMQCAQSELTIQLNIEAAKQYRCCEDWIYRHYGFLFAGA